MGIDRIRCPRDTVIAEIDSDRPASFGDSFVIAISGLRAAKPVRQMGPLPNSIRWHVRVEQKRAPNPRRCAALPLPDLMAAASSLRRAIQHHGQIISATKSSEIRCWQCSLRQQITERHYLRNLRANRFNQMKRILFIACGSGDADYSLQRGRHAMASQE